jgi:hypothetical protein
MFARPLIASSMSAGHYEAGEPDCHPDGHLEAPGGIAEFGATRIRCLSSGWHEFVTYITNPALTGP